MKSILILCTGNSCRSQMAEGFLKKYLGNNFNVQSAGIEKHGLNPRAVEAMSEVGIDISNHYSKTLDELDTKKFDYVLTVCDNAKENCPVFPAKTQLIHQSFTDPVKMNGTEAETKEFYSVCREAIGHFCEDLARKISSN